MAMEAAGTAAAFVPVVGEDEEEAEESWSIATFARLKPRTQEDEDIPFIPYTLHAEQGRTQTLELLRGPRGGELDVHGGHGGDDQWELDAGATAALAEKPGHNLWHFDKVFDTGASQEEVFHAAAQPAVLGAMDGYNGTVFAYGQTGSGKTFTVQGGEGYTHRGMVPRAIQALFDEVEARRASSPEHQHQHEDEEVASGTGSAEGGSVADPQDQYRVSVSFCEIYNEGVYDLLDTSPARNGPIEEWPRVEMQMDRDGQLQLKGLRTFLTTSCEEALSLYFLGVTNRVTSATPMNHASSRSHAVFTIHVEATEAATAAEGVSAATQGKVHFVDLAGSERVYKSRRDEDEEGALADAFNVGKGVGMDVTHDAKTRFEGKHINLSLHFLEQVIVCLQNRTSLPDPRKAHIPYRNSVLTSYLRDALGGNCRTTFVVALSLAAENLDETVSTCRFANRCAQLQVQVHKNRPANVEHQVIMLEHRVAQLEARLAEQNRAAAEASGLLSGSLQHAAELRWRLARHGRSALSHEEQGLCRALVEKYIHNGADAEQAIHGDARIAAELDAVFHDTTLELAATQASTPEAEAVARLRATSELLARLDDERADGGMLREVVRLLRAHVVHAAQVAAASTGDLTEVHKQLALSAEERAALEQRERELRERCTELADRCNELSAACGFGPMGVGQGAALRAGSQSISDEEGEEESDGGPQEAHPHPHHHKDREVSSGSGWDHPHPPVDSKVVAAALASDLAHNSRAVVDIRSQLDRSTLKLSSDTLAAMLTSGTLFLKHGRRGSPRGRWIWLSPDMSVLRWRRHGEARARGELVLQMFRQVQLGANGFVNRVRPELEDSFLVLTGPDRRLVLQVDAGNSPDVRLRARNAWAFAFALLLGAATPTRPPTRPLTARA